MNIYGLPDSDSSHISLWPILARIDQTKEKTPFVVALFEAPSKPDSASEYLRDFIDEVKQLEANGILIENVCYQLRIRYIIADYVL